MQRLIIPIQLFLAGVFFLPVAGAQQVGRGAKSLSRATDILKQWEEGRHLYVKGSVGVDAGGLASLEAWLARNGKNWTVVLVENANGEVYRDASGRSYSGAAAVEYSLGLGMRNQGGFSKSVDPRTGQRDGAILAILMRERKFFYSGSEIHDRRGLGKDSWAGDLDRPAFRAMSNGRRVADAVRHTVEEVGSRLTRRLQAEQKERERKLRKQQQRLAQAGRTVEDLAGKVDGLEKALAAFRSGHPGVDGDMVSEQMVPLLRDGLKSARTALAAGIPAEALELAEPLVEFTDVHRQALADYDGAGADFAALNEEIGKIVPGREGWGADRLALAREELAKAQESHGKGNSIYRVELENAREALRSAKQELARAADELRAEMARDEELQRRSELAERRAQRNFRLLLGALALGLGGLLYYLNRRTRATRAEAQTLVANWESGFEDKTDQLFALLDRTNVVVGTEVGLPQRGYTGETLRLSKQTIEDVDQLFIMSSTVARLLREARDEVYPKYGFQRVYNWFGSSRYRSALRKLRDELVTFSPEDGVELLSREKMKQAEGLLGNLESYQPFALSFPKLMEEFNRRAARATAALDLIEESWASISGELDAGREEINVAADFESEVAGESAADGLFRLEPVFSVLLPSAGKDLDEAIEVGATDPVGALAEPLPRARRKAGDASELTGVVLAARGERFPLMRVEMQLLEKSGHGTAWVGRFLREFSARADEIAAVGVDGSVGDDVVLLGREFLKLERRCVRARELAERLAVTAGEEVSAVRDAVKVAREEIGSGLGLPADSILRERGLDPDVLLTEADELRAAASLAIDRGGVDAAEAALDEVAALMKEGLDLIGMTRASFGGHLARIEECRRETRSLEAGVGRHRSVLDFLKSNYEESVLELSAGDPSHPTPGVSVTEHIAKVGRDLAEAHERQGEAQSAYEQARLVEAAALLSFVDDLQHRVGRHFDEIRDRQERIEKMEQSNGQLIIKLDDEMEAMLAGIDDHRTMRPTIARYEEAGRDLQSARMRAEMKPGDPFKAGAMLVAVEQKLELVRGMAQSDRERFDELARSLQESASHIAKAKEVSRQSVADRIPDSRRITELQESIEKLFAAQADCERDLKEPHGDWGALDREADEITGYAARATAEMRGELKRAQAAVAAINGAAGSVREASGWVGLFGVRISGSPGSRRLRGAREALMNGDYYGAQRNADDAGRAARQAIVAARAAVDRKRRAAARAAEARRRRSSFSSSSSSGSGFSFGGGGGGGSSSMGGSSFSSGGSGMGSSGW